MAETEVEKLLFKLEADTKDLLDKFKEAVNQVTQGTSKVTDSVNKVNPELAKLGKGFDAVKDGLREFAIGMGKGVLGGLAFAEMLRRTFENAMEAERGLVRLEQTLKTSANATGITVDRVEALAKSLERASTFDTGSIVAGIDVLISFGNVSSDILQQAAQGAVDLAAKMRTDVPSAARLFARALAEPGDGLEALRRSGVRFSDAQIEMVKNIRLASGELAAQQKVMELVAAKGIGGTAAAENVGLYGGLKAASKAMNNLLETVGRSPVVWAPVVASLNILSTTLEAVDNLLQQVGSTFTAFWNTITRKPKEQNPVDVLQNLRRQLDRLKQELQEDVTPQVLTAQGFGSLEERAANLREQIKQLEGMIAELEKKNPEAVAKATDENLKQFEVLSKELGFVTEGYKLVQKDAAKYAAIEQGLSNLYKAGKIDLETKNALMEVAARKYGDLATASGVMVKQLQDEIKVLQASEFERERIKFLQDAEEQLNKEGLTGDARKKRLDQLKAEFDAKKNLNDVERARVTLMQQAQKTLQGVADVEQKGLDDLKNMNDERLKQIDNEKRSTRQLLEQVEAAKKSYIEWDNLSEAYRVNDRELKIVQKTQELMNSTWGLGREEARKLAEQAVDASEEMRKANARNEKILKDQERAQEMMLEPFKNALRGIQSAFSDFFEKVFEGGVNSFKDLASAAKKIFIKLAAEVAALMVFRPVVAGTLNFMGMGGIASQLGLGGLSMPGASTQNAAAAGGGFNPLSMLNNVSSIGSMFSGNGFLSSSSLSSYGNGISNFFNNFSLSSLNPGSWFSSGASAAANPVLSTAGGGGAAAFGLGGATGAYGAVGGGFGGGLGGAGMGGGGAAAFGVGGASTAAPAFSLGGALGAAGIGFGIGQLSRSLFGGSKTAGMIGGGIGGGIAGGALAGTAIMPGIGTVAGAIIGAVAGILGGSLGGKKSVGPNSNANLIYSNGKFVVGNSAADNGGDLQAAVRQTQAIADAINTVTSNYGLKSSGGFLDVGNFKGQLYLGSGGGPGVNNFYQTDDADQLAFQAFKALIGQGGVSVPAGAMGTVIANSKATTLSDLSKDLDIGKLYDTVVAMKRPLTDVEQAMKALNDQFDQALPRVRDLGLNVQAFTTGFRDTFNRDIADAILKITDPLQAALDEFDRGAAARVETARKLGADLVQVEKLNALARQQVIEQMTGGSTALDSRLAYLGANSPLDPMGKFDLASQMYAEGKLGKDDYATIARSTFASTERYANIFSSIYGALPGRASGGPAFGLTRVGEFGPEVVDFRTPVMVYRNGTSPSNDNGGSNSQVISALVSEMRSLREEFSRTNRELAIDNQRKRFSSSRS